MATTSAWSRCALVAAFAAACLLIAAGDGEALTSPLSGAVALPRSAVLRAPFPCGVSYRISCAYGCGLHRGTTSTSSSNDYYALDLVRTGSGGGFDKPLVAIAAGTVRYAAWATGGWSPYGRIVLIEHDFGDGQRYMSLYAHLNHISVHAGQKVAAGATIGKLGRSGNVTGAHVHFALYRDAKIGGGPYGGRATVPEPMGGAQDFRVGQTHTARCPAPKKDAAPPKPDAGAPTRRDSGASGKRDSAPNADSVQPTRPAAGPSHPSPDAGGAFPFRDTTLYGTCGLGGAPAPCGWPLLLLTLLFARRIGRRGRAGARGIRLARGRGPERSRES